MSLVLVPPFILLWLLISHERHGRRGAALLAAVAWGVALTLITEALTLLRALDFKGLSLAWAATTLALLFVYLRRVRKPGADASPPLGRWRLEVGRLCLLPTSSRVLLAGVALVVVAVGVDALAVAPNTFDSMTYHMARVAHWAQNRGVEHYPTHNLRQLYLSPWAEWAILHAQVLSGGDRLANLAQWCCMVGSLAGVSLIAKQLGADARSQVLAAVVAASVPMGILQASGTQNDYVVTFWLVCFVHCLLLLRARPRLAYALAAGASLGLALLTKGTAYVYAPPFLIWLAFALYRRLGRGFWRPCLAACAMALLLNAGHYARNIDTFGSPLGVDRRGHVDGVKLSNDLFTAPAFVSNVARNVGLHAGVPVVQSYAKAAIDRLHALLGLDDKDPRTTFTGTTFQIPHLNTNEDMAGNPLHLALILLSTGLAYRWRGKAGGRRALLVYTACLVAAFLSFCFYLRWQLWHSRLHLPLFVLWSPLVAAALTTIPRRRVADAAAAVLLLLAPPWVLFNTNRPLLRSRALRTAESVFRTGRVEEYFNTEPWTRDSYVRAAQALTSRNCSSVGLDVGGDQQEYQLWALLGAHAGAGARLEHVSVTNPSARHYGRPPFDAFEPCAIFARRPAWAARTFAENDQSFERVFESGDIQVFLKRQGL